MCMCNAMTEIKYIVIQLKIYLAECKSGYVVAKWKKVWLKLISMKIQNGNNN